MEGCTYTVRCSIQPDGLIAIPRTRVGQHVSAAQPVVLPWELYIYIYPGLHYATPSPDSHWPRTSWHCPQHTARILLPC